jgi:cell division protein FtsQ
MYLSESGTTFLGRRIGYNESKRKQARKEKIKRGFKGALRWFKRCGWIFCILIVAVGVALWQNRFYVQRFNPLELRHLKYIDIEGNRMLTWEDVIQNAQVEPGMLMSEVVPDSIEKMLLRSPLIRSVEVKKHFPSSMSILLEESKPVASYFENGKATVYSERGLPLPLSTSTALRLPIVEQGSLEDVRPISRFLYEMQKLDPRQYSLVSQVGWSSEKLAFEVFFRDVDFHVLYPQSGWNRDMLALYDMVKAGFPQDLRCAGEVDLRFIGFAYVRNFDKRCVNG